MEPRERTKKKEGRKRRAYPESTLKVAAFCFFRVCLIEVWVCVKWEVKVDEERETRRRGGFGILHRNGR